MAELEITDQAGVTVCHRVHVPAGLPFRRSMGVAPEHGSGNVHRGRDSGVVLDEPREAGGR